MPNATRVQTRSDSPTRICTKDGCERPLRARGLCNTHYMATRPERHKKHEVACIVCGAITHKISGGRRKVGAVCSNECRRVLTFGERCELPDDHWARWYGRSTPVNIRRCATCDRPFTSPKLNARRCFECRERRPARFTNGECGECGTWFTAETSGSPIEYCSRRCQRRVAKRARRAQEHGAPGAFRYVDLMRIYRQFDGRCAYCDQTIDGLPEPEHVVPISRGGRNEIGNLLPACRPCNIDKNDRTPTEWQATREARGLPPIRDDFPFQEPRFRHLVQALPNRATWLNRSGRNLGPEDFLGAV